jgi:mannan endo-1,4-beta-mannosidase
VGFLVVFTSIILTPGHIDVTEIPVNGTWFQLIKNGTTTINDGPNGLQKLDKIVQFAEEAGVKIIFSLTNNWNPLPLVDNSTLFNNTAALTRRDITFGTNNSLPRNFLSNDYGTLQAFC